VLSAVPAYGVGVEARIAGFELWYVIYIQYAGNTQIVPAKFPSSLTAYAVEGWLAPASRGVFLL